MINRVRESNKKPGARVMSVWIQHDNADGTYGVNHDGCVKPSPIYFICGIHPARGWEVEPGDIHSYFSMCHGNIIYADFFGNILI